MSDGRAPREPRADVAELSHEARGASEALEHGARRVQDGAPGDVERGLRSDHLTPATQLNPHVARVGTGLHSSDGMLLRKDFEEDAFRT